MQVRCWLVVLGMTLIAPSLVTPSLAASAAPCRSATETLGEARLHKVYDGGVIVQAQYITREEQKTRAEENLRQHRERANPPPSVERSTGTPTGETYGREWQERQIQGTDKPRVTRPW